MAGGVAPFLLIALAFALLYAAWGDWRRRDIPNWLSGGIALAAPLYWWAAGIALFPDAAIIAGLALALFLLFAIAFAMGGMGGGDVKLIGALALWLTPLQLPAMLLVMALAGGAITLAMVAWRRGHPEEAKIEVPYGIAISIGGLWVIGNQILTILAERP
ncbi:MAG: prepilin peptidase [Sphingomonadaceae bacterium]|nr:prepilin peptidase [Sphingomonadaceae bacterium]